MDVPFGIIFAIITAFGWGISEFLAKKVVDQIGYLRSLFYAQLIGSIPLLVYILYATPAMVISIASIILALSVGLIGTLAYLSMYNAFEKGNVSIVSPIVASWATITVILALIFLSELPTQIQITGIIFAILGVILTSFKYSKSNLAPKVPVYLWIVPAVVSAISFGSLFLLLRFLVDYMGDIVPILFIRIIAVLFLFGLSVKPNRRIGFPVKNIFGLLIVIGILDAGAYITYIFGISMELVSIVSPIASLHAAVTVVFAGIFLRERLASNQKLGILTIMIGVLLLSI